MEKEIQEDSDQPKSKGSEADSVLESPDSEAPEEDLTTGAERSAEETASGEDLVGGETSDHQDDRDVDGDSRDADAEDEAADLAPVDEDSATASAVGGEEDPSGEASFGTWLRRQRKMREIELRDIAEQTKISLRYLEAMEQDRFDVLPAPVFARGFLREYARYVGLNGDEVVNYYLASHEGADLNADAGDETVSMSTPSRGPVSKRFLAALVLALLAAAVIYFYFYERSQENQEEAAPPPIAAPALPMGEPPPEPEADEPVVSAAPLVVTLDFTQECWLEAQVDRGERTSQLFVAGESLQLEAEEIVVLENVGNYQGVQVQVNSEPFQLPEPQRGVSVRNVIIDRDSFATTGGSNAQADAPGGA